MPIMTVRFGDDMAYGYTSIYIQCEIYLEEADGPGRISSSYSTFTLSNSIYRYKYFPFSGKKHTYIFNSHYVQLTMHLNHLQMTPCHHCRHSVDFLYQRLSVPSLFGNLAYS